MSNLIQGYQIALPFELSGSDSSLLYSGSQLIISGSVDASQGFTGSLYGTSSWAENAITASYALNGGESNIDTSSFATTGSNTFIGNQTITGSNGVLKYGGTISNPSLTLAEIHTKDDEPWLERFYNDSFSTTNSVMSYFGWNDGRFVFHNDSTQSIGIQVNGYNAQNGLLVYSDKVAFVNNIETTGSISNGYQNIASGSYSHAEGDSSIANGYGSHAEGWNTYANEGFSHAEGIYTSASGYSAHAEGDETDAHGYYSHAEGNHTITSGSWSHAEGFYTVAEGIYSHTEGEFTHTIGYASHAEGLGTITSGSYQHVQGRYNISSSDSSAFIIGNGIDDINRSNLVFASGSEFQITGSLNISGSINFAGLNLSQISTGSVTASVNVGPNEIFLIQSSSQVFVEISGSSNTNFYSDLFIIKNFTTKQAIFTVSQSIVQFATQSIDPTGTTQAGSIWFTSTNMYVGLD